MVGTAGLLDDFLLFLLVLDDDLLLLPVAVYG